MAPPSWRTPAPRICFTDPCMYSLQLMPDDWSENVFVPRRGECPRSPGLDRGGGEDGRRMKAPRRCASARFPCALHIVAVHRAEELRRGPSPSRDRAARGSPRAARRDLRGARVRGVRRRADGDAQGISLRSSHPSKFRVISTASRSAVDLTLVHRTRTTPYVLPHASKCTNILLCSSYPPRKTSLVGTTR